MAVGPCILRQLSPTCDLKRKLSGVVAMSISNFQAVVNTVLLLALISCSRSISVSQPVVFVTLDPPEATVHVGQVQRFAAVVKGTDKPGVLWEVEERDGGRITEDGVYTAPGIAGIYHVVATSKAGPHIRAVAKVTVVTEYDT